MHSIKNTKHLYSLPEAQYKKNPILVLTSLVGVMDKYIEAREILNGFIEIERTLSIKITDLTQQMLLLEPDEQNKIIVEIDAKEEALNNIRYNEADEIVKYLGRLEAYYKNEMEIIINAIMPYKSSNYIVQSMQSALRQIVQYQEEQSISSDPIYEYESLETICQNNSINLISNNLEKRLNTQFDKIKTIILSDDELLDFYLFEQHFHKTQITDHKKFVDASAIDPKPLDANEVYNICRTQKINELNFFASFLQKIYDKWPAIAKIFGIKNRIKLDITQLFGLKKQSIIDNFSEESNIDILHFLSAKLPNNINKYLTRNMKTNLRNKIPQDLLTINDIVMDLKSTNFSLPQIQERLTAAEFQKNTYNAIIANIIYENTMLSTKYKELSREEQEKVFFLMLQKMQNNNNHEGQYLANEIFSIIYDIKISNPDLMKNSTQILNLDTMISTEKPLNLDINNMDNIENITLVMDTINLSHESSTINFSQYKQELNMIQDARKLSLIYNELSVRDKASVERPIRFRLDKGYGKKLRDYGEGSEYNMQQVVDKIIKSIKKVTKMDIPSHFEMDNIDNISKKIIYDMVERILQNALKDHNDARRFKLIGASVVEKRRINTKTLLDKTVDNLLKQIHNSSPQIKNEISSM